MSVLLYESRFEKEYGFFRPIVKEVVEMLRVFFKYKRRLFGRRFPGPLTAPPGRR